MARADSAQNAADLRDIVSRAMTALDVAGAGVAVVHHDEAVLCDGFGVRDLESGGAVDDETLFAIGSATKAFTTMSIAMLAEEGKLDWDIPVRSYMPDFALHDAVAGAEATPKDLACHRVGLPRHELSWYKADLSRAELVGHLRHLEPSRPFRTTFQYQNMMFTTLGYLVERLSGKTWEEFAAERILVPLGMERSNFSVHRSQMDANHARPYARRDGVNMEVPFADIDALGPAGAVNSCAKDMAGWLRLHLSDGEIDGARLVSAASLNLMHSPQMVIPQAVRDERRHAPAYGLGWFTEVYMGKEVVHHGGNIDGFSAMVMLVPEEGLGVAVLCNQEVSALPAAVAYGVVDRMLGLPERDWPFYLQGEMEKLLAVAHQGGDYSQEQVKGTTPSLALQAYAGTYEHPAYGVLRIVPGAQGLALAYHPWPEPLPLEHFHYDVFLVHAELETIPTSWRIPFRLGLDGRVESLEVQFELTTPPIVFRRRPEAHAHSRQELSRYAGFYLIAGVQKMRIELKGDAALALTLEGQPPYELVPEGQGRFGLEGLQGFHVQFDLASDGTCRGGQVIQPNGVFPFMPAV